MTDMFDSNILLQNKISLLIFSSHSRLCNCKIDKNHSFFSHTRQAYMSSAVEYFAIFISTAHIDRFFLTHKNRERYRETDVPMTR